MTRDGTHLTLSKGGGQVSVEDSDSDPTNELQSLSQEGNVVSLSQNGGSVAIDIDDDDADPANELQTLERIGSEISLSHGGGTVSVEDADPDPENEKVSEFLLDGYTLRLTESGQPRTVDMSGFLPPPNPDPDPTNELQTLTANPDYTVTLSGGGGTVAINPNMLTDQLNTGVGVRAFPHLVSGLTTAANNTAVGSLAMASAYDDSFGNTAVGTTALANLTTGNFNTALGDRALGYSSAGTWNTAVGHGALLHTTGNENTGVGSDALGSNHSGGRNTGLGHYALRQNQSSGNTAVGHRAGYNKHLRSEQPLLEQRGSGRRIRHHPDRRNRPQPHVPRRRPASHRDRQPHAGGHRRKRPTGRRRSQPGHHGLRFEFPNSSSRTSSELASLARWAKTQGTKFRFPRIASRL